MGASVTIAMPIYTIKTAIAIMFCKHNGIFKLGQIILCLWMDGWMDGWIWLQNNMMLFYNY